MNPYNNGKKEIHDGIIVFNEERYLHVVPLCYRVYSKDLIKRNLSCAIKKHGLQRVRVRFNKEGYYYLLIDNIWA